MERQNKIIKTSIKGIIVNILLVIFKLIIGFIANSIAIILDAINNLTDALSSIITIIGTKLSTKAPDKEHPYGHGRIEYFTSIIIGIIILVAGVLSLKESFTNIINPTKPNYTVYTIIIIITAIIVKILLGSYVKNIGNKINSGSLIASGTDALFDAILSTGTLIAILSYLLFKINIEGIIGLLISLFILKSSIELLKETSSELIGTRVNKELAIKLKEAINLYPEVEGTYDLVLHNYGPMQMIGSVHIQVKDTMTAKEIHILTKEIEKKIYTSFGIILTIGIYASNTSDKESLKIKTDLEKIISNYKEILQLHGFYIDSKKNQINFDIIVDFNTKSPEKIKRKVINEIKKLYPNYTYYVIIDNDFSD
ncbi:MAG: cation transporter [Bacilli bacterium]|nr:cation transporter [Bacilli bacterium]